MMSSQNDNKIAMSHFVCRASDWKWDQIARDKKYDFMHYLAGSLFLFLLPRFYYNFFLRDHMFLAEI